MDGSVLDWEQLPRHWSHSGLRIESLLLVVRFLSMFCFNFTSVVQSCDSLWPHKLQHTKPPCSSPTPRVHSDSCPLSLWCHPAISFSVFPISSCPPIPPSIRVFSNESTLHMRWPKYWSFSFSISASSEHPGLISKFHLGSSLIKVWLPISYSVYCICNDSKGKLVTFESKVA